MKGFFYKVKILSNFMYWLSGVALVCILVLTVGDVILRKYFKPIAGIYDLTILLGAIVIGFATPITTLRKAHVCVTFLTEKVTLGWRKGFKIITHCMEIFLFSLLGFELISSGIELYRAGEVSDTIHLPLYLFELGIGVSFLVNCLIILFMIFDEGGKV